jgi:redox-sensing transcriptional repressor
MSPRTIERLAVYRRVLAGLLGQGLEHIYSHQLAELIGLTSAQVRRDIMTIGYVATSKKGYDVGELLEKIDGILSPKEATHIALVGVGNLGRAILSYFNHQHSALRIVAAFDADENRVDRVIAGCRCHPMKDMEGKIREENIEVGIITVPDWSAQEVADALVAAGVKGILNFAPVPVRVPDYVYVDRIDITTAIEKIVYFISEGDKAGGE